MRIISGKLKGRKLFSIKGRSVRPTADHLRESIFNILSTRVTGSVVLDLFAGTGSLGIEALSRESESAVFLDNSKDAVSVINRNIKACNLEDRSSTIRWNIKTNLNCIKSSHPAFNLVFMDPPYNKNFLEPALKNISHNLNMADNNIIIIEHSLLEPVPILNSYFSLLDQRRYGKTLVSFLEYDIKNDNHKIEICDGTI